MSKIADLLAELSRNDDHIPYYNGVEIKETEIAYQRKLDTIYNDAVVELFSGSIDKDMLIKRLGEIMEVQSCFYCPSKEEIQSRRDEEKQSKSESLKKETDYLEFMSRCIELQRYYMSRFSEYYPDAHLQETVEPEPTISTNKHSTEMRDAEKEDAIIKGVEGLAKFLGCGKTKAQDIINSGKLQKAGIAYRPGKGWRFNREKLDAFIKENPTAFRWNT